MEEAEADEKASAFDVLDRVLCLRSNSKYSIYTAFSGELSQAEKVKFLLETYGIGGISPVLKSSDEDYYFFLHNGSGIQLTHYMPGNEEQVLTYSWAEAAARIDVLLQENRYLTRQELEEYPNYLREREILERRAKVGGEYTQLLRDYNAYLRENSPKDAPLNLYVMLDCVRDFIEGNKTTGALPDRNFVLPLMRMPLHSIVDCPDVDLADRAKEMLEALSSLEWAEMEPTPAQLQPMLPAKTEYRFEPGESVWLDGQELCIAEFSLEEVTVVDVDHPLFRNTMPYSDFRASASTDSRNDRYLVSVYEEPEVAEPPVAASEEPAKPKAPEFRIGDTVVLDGDSYTIESVGIFDIVLHENAPSVYPIDRAESKENLTRLLQRPGNRLLHKQENTIEDGERSISTVPLPEIAPQNYRIPEVLPDAGSPEEKYRRNVAAIQTLRTLEDENRAASPQNRRFLPDTWAGAAYRPCSMKNPGITPSFRSC